MAPATEDQQANTFTTEAHPEEFIVMGNKLTDAQRAADICPDCGSDPDEPKTHRVTCRRLGMSPLLLAITSADGTRPTHGELQCGPPWRDWPEGVEPVNPIAEAH
jgi:hypothetical protein